MIEVPNCQCLAKCLHALDPVNFRWLPTSIKHCPVDFLGQFAETPTLRFHRNSGQKPEYSIRSNMELFCCHLHFMPIGCNFNTSLYKNLGVHCLDTFQVLCKIARKDVSSKKDEVGVRVICKKGGESLNQPRSTKI